MTTLAVRPARPFDAGAMAALVTRLAAPAHPLAGADLRDWMAEGDIWHVAEIAGDLTGLQWAGPEFRPSETGLPDKTLAIATFVAPGRHALTAGSALFEATRRAAKARGIARLVATLPEGNDGALAYYRSRGFETLASAAETVTALYRL